MSDDITIRELVAIGNEDMFAWAVFHLMTIGPVDSFMEKFKIDASNHDNTVNVEMRVNGVEVSPRQVFKRLAQEHDNMLKRQAAELLKEKLGASTELLFKLEQLIQREAQDALGVDWENR